MAIVIYHNPECGTSRNTLAIIRQSGEAPEVIEYLKTPPRSSVSRTPSGPRRNSSASCSVQPILINRPIVVTPKGVKSEVVLDVLPNPDIGPFTKEDGEVIINKKGERVVRN